ncbi:RDD family protein [Nocardioides sp. SYSU DS0663]|uniref:RDD family protein n=1 Tax=Nocardioides sp. SYSU DS0663 TaxID=3416445 RepID=UPI003F4C4AD9
MAVAAEAPATAFPAAGLDRRLHAFLLDRLVGWGVYAVAAGLAWWLVRDGAALGAAVGIVAGAVLLVVLVHALLLGLRGTSPGKAATGLRVVHAGTGDPIGVPAALLRVVLLGLATVPTFGLGLATLAWTAVADRGGRRRGAHDVLTHAVVVDVRPAPVVVEEVASAPRQVVNLTALRLLPTPAQPSLPAPPSLPAAPREVAPEPPAPPRPPVAAEPPPPAAPVTPPAPRPAADRTVVRGSGAAPARWRISVDTGESLLVEGLALLGRRPEAREGEPVRHLLALRSDDMSLSKTHAQLQVAPDGVLVVMDRGSTNGSVLLRQGTPRPLSAGRPVTLVDGDRVRLGDRELAVTREG